MSCEVFDVREGLKLDKPSLDVGQLDSIERHKLLQASQTTPK